MGSIRRSSTWADDGLARILQRLRSTQGQVSGFPHSAGRDGVWNVTMDGDWTGGSWIGCLWLSGAIEPHEPWWTWARVWLGRLAPRVKAKSAFKGFGFYYGGVLGWEVSGDTRARQLAIECANNLCEQFDERLMLIPLGMEAEEGGNVGSGESSIDSLQASPLLFWAANVTSNNRMREVAIAHTDTVIRNHLRADRTIIQSTSLDPSSGRVLRQYTHKGFSDQSTWARAQAWGMLYTTICSSQAQDQKWLDAAIDVSDWWLENVPSDMVSYWDFDDPSIPHTERDTSATAIAAAALLKLSEIVTRGCRADAYRDAAIETTRILVKDYLSPTANSSTTPTGVLSGGCFNHRPDSRGIDAVTNGELIFGTYFLLETLVHLVDTRFSALKLSKVLKRGDVV